MKDLLKYITNNIIESKSSTAILVVDFQNDFVDGSLAVSGAKELVLPIEEFIIRLWYTANNITYIFTKDVHPVQHCSFKENGGLWPAHCVEDTHGAEFAFTTEFIDEFLPKLENTMILFKKGQEEDREEYSPFNLEVKTRDLLENRYLKLGQINDIETFYVFGLATDYCVKNTTLDLVAAGFKVIVISDLCKGVDSETTKAAIEEMRAAGVIVL